MSPQWQDSFTWVGQLERNGTTPILMRLVCSIIIIVSKGCDHIKGRWSTHKLSTCLKKFSASSWHSVSNVKNCWWGARHKQMMKALNLIFLILLCEITLLNETFNQWNYQLHEFHRVFYFTQTFLVSLERSEQSQFLNRVILSMKSALHAMQIMGSMTIMVIIASKLPFHIPQFYPTFPKIMR